MNKLVVYDVETIKNLFTACFLDVETGKRKEFVLYDDIEEFYSLVKFLTALRQHGYTLLGFNCLNFDSQILEHILGNLVLPPELTIQEIVASIYTKAQDIINMPDEDKFQFLVPEWRLSIPHVDLFKQKHYDGKAKMGTSLKWVQFTMRYPNIEEMPITHDTVVSKEEIPLILGYNWNDVLSTFEFYKKIKFETDLRVDLSEKYKMSLINASEPRLAKMIFGKFLSEDMKIPFSELKDKRTFRREIRMKNLIFKYIKFKTEKLQEVLTAIKQVTINPNDKPKFEYNFNYGGIQTYIGLGGIHACCSPGAYVKETGRAIHDMDITSFYPMLAIKNNIKPWQLGDSFGKIYNDIFEQRKKIPKTDPVNYVFKIILNSTYGLSKEINCYLYDPLFTYSITINGQLTLLMLVEMLVENIPGLTMFQQNTDGITVGYDERYKGQVIQICEEFQKITQQNLEHCYYEKMIIRDVNSYIGVKQGFDWVEYQQYVSEGKRRDYEKIKHKGVFDLEIEYHKNPSFYIVSLAAEAYFINNKDYKQFIYENEDIYNFFGAVKRKSNFDLNLYTLKEGEKSVKPQQKVTRFYVSKDGGMLIKDFHDGRQTAVLANWKVDILNKVEATHPKDYPDLDYRFYIKETEKLITAVEGNILQMKLF